MWVGIHENLFPPKLLSFSLELQVWTSRNILAIAHKTKNSQCKDCAAGCSRWPISSFPNCSTSLELQVWTWRETLHPSLTSTFSLSRPAWNTDSLPILYCNVALLLILTLKEPGVEKMMALTFNYISQPFDSTGYIHFHYIMTMDPINLLMD